MEVETKLHTNKKTPTKLNLDHDFVAACAAWVLLPVQPDEAVLVRRHTLTGV